MAPDKTLVFDQPVILVGGGAVNQAAFEEIMQFGYPVIAADGGANFLRQANICPDAIIGDMDSISDKEHWVGKTQFLEIAEQDTTDFEKCLYVTNAPLYYGFGLLGGRFDHSLAAIHVLTKYAGTKEVLIVDNIDIVITATGAVTFDLDPGERISIYPLTKVRFEGSTGLKFPLKGLTFKQGTMIGTSNEALGGIVEIKADSSGSYLVILGVSHLASIARGLV